MQSCLYFFHGFVVDSMCGKMALLCVAFFFGVMHSLLRCAVVCVTLGLPMGSAAL